MNTKLSTNRKLIRMLVNILSIVVMLAMAFPATGSAYAQDGTALPYGYHDGTEGNAQAGNCAAFGWAVDPDDRGRAVLVRVLSDDVQVAETPADDYGSDMEENEICPDGNCRFTVNLWELISLGQPHQITVQAHDVETDQWVNLWETPRSLTCNPHLEAFAWTDRLSLADWPANVPINIVIENPDYTGQFTPDGSSNWYDFFPGVDLRPGSIISATSGEISKTLIVSTLSATVDAATGSVTGFATPNRGFHMRTLGDTFANPVGQDITADAGGNWSADLSAFAPLEWFTRGEMWEADEDGDVTYSIWHVHNELIEVWLAHNEIDAFDWPLNTKLTFTVYDPVSDKTYNYYAGTEPVPWMDGTIALVTPDDLALAPGMTVSVTDGNVSTSTVIQDIKITHADPDNDLVYGYAPDGASLKLRSWEDNPAFRFFNAEQDGSWTVDYRIPSVNGTTVDVNIGDTFTLYMLEPDKDGTVWGWDVRNPRMVVFPEWEWFDGWDWPDGATVTITVEGKDDCTTVKESWGYFFNGNFNNFDNGCNIEVGDVVTFTDDTTTRTHTVRNLAVTAVNELSNTVSGASDPYETVYVWQHEPGPQIPFEANENGEWLADLNGVYDIRSGSGGRSEIRDETGNSTAVDWNVPNPHFTIYPEQERFEAYDWPDGSIVTMTVDGKPECETSKESWGGFFDGNFVAGCDVVIGDTVTFTYGSTTRTYIVQNLVITEVNKDANTVAGTADAGALLDAWIHGVDGSWMQLTAENGAWLADFGSMGFDLQNSMGGRIQINDAMGNATAVDWYIANPRFTVFPEWEWFDGWDWPDGAIVTITVADKPECETTKESWGYFFNGNFGEGCNVETGDTVTFTDGTITRTHTVENLAVTKVNHEDNIIKGIANAGAEIHVWPHATGQEQLVTANPQGKWNVDFTGIYDLMPGDDGRTEIRDVMGNATAVDWHIPRPRIVASITEDWFYLQEFSPNTTLDFTVYKAQYGKPIWKGTATTDGSGFAWIDAEGRWNLEPGNYLIVKDGSNSKDLVIEGFTFDVFNLSNGQLSGTAPSDRNVWVGIGWENDGWSMDVTTDETGAWLADFGQPVPSDYWWVAAQIFDPDGDASELRPDRIVDLWVAAYTYDAGTWSEGGHNYHFEAKWNGGSETTNEIFFNVSGEAQAYDGYVLLRPGAVRVAPDCAEVDAIRPDQPTRFLAGYVTDYPMTYSEAQAYFDSLSASAVWDGGQSTELTRHEIMPFRSDDWFQYVCTFTADLVLDASQPDWVDSGITISAGQSFTIEAFGLMNPCSDTYPNGGEFCIFYTPVGGEWAVPYENQFGIFPGPGLPFMALLGRIGDGQPFLVGEGGTFTAEQDGTLWFTPNDNLRTDNQGAYSLLVWLEP